MEQKTVRKVLDNTGLYEAWYEEVPKPAHNNIPLVGVRCMDMIHDGQITLDDLEDLGQIVAGDAPGRKNDDEIIIMSVGGMPVKMVLGQQWCIATLLKRHRRTTQPMETPALR